MVVGPNQPISLSNLCSNILYLFDLQLLKKKSVKISHDDSFPLSILSNLALYVYMPL